MKFDVNCLVRFLTMLSKADSRHCIALELFYLCINIPSEGTVSREVIAGHTTDKKRFT